jgi:1-hydroxycarotenoid 3,4-desaturase
MKRERVVVIGAGIGGLAAAIGLALRGVDVTVLEKADKPGGKMREAVAGSARIDAGPTVLTMRWVFDELFAEAGEALDDFLVLHPAETLARHFWTNGTQLDLYSDIDRTADAIGAFAGSREARGYRDFCARAQRIYDTLSHSFIRAQRPNPVSLARRVGNLGDLWGISPFKTLWSALGEHFRDERLRQLFGRYATYCGSSPFDAPATLMLVAHVEREGVWLPEGGMQRIAEALEKFACARGVQIRYACDVREIATRPARVSGVMLSSGEHIEADAVVLNADPAALAEGRFGPALAGAAPRVTREQRSLSAITFALSADANGFPLARHNVFFSNDTVAEFDDIFRHRRIPDQPTVYVCAQDRDDAATPRTPERLLCLINAPPDGDTHDFRTEIGPCTSRTFALLERCGLTVTPQSATVTTPTDFNRMFPGTGGALYGPASHGWMASFRRPGSRTQVPGLYLAGGSVHPGPGVPMAALSGRLAAESVLADFASMRRSVPADTRGGTSMPSAMTARTRSR